MVSKHCTHDSESHAIGHHGCATQEVEDTSSTPAGGVPQNLAVPRQNGAVLHGAAGNLYPSYVISHKLNEDNYLQWLQNFLMFLWRRRRANTWQRNSTTSWPKFKIWHTENSLVMSLLVMNLEISDSYLLATTAKDIWDSVRQTFSYVENVAALF